MTIWLEIGLSGADAKSCRQFFATAGAQGSPVLAKTRSMISDGMQPSNGMVFAMQVAVIRGRTGISSPRLYPGDAVADGAFAVFAEVRVRRLFEAELNQTTNDH